MGIELVYLQIVAPRIPLAAKVAGHQPGRDAGRPQHEGGGHGVVAAKAAPALEQKIIHPVLPQPWWLQGVVEVALTKLAQQGGGELLWRRMASLEHQGVGPCLGVAGGGQLQVELAGRLAG